MRALYHRGLCQWRWSILPYIVVSFLLGSCVVSMVAPCSVLQLALFWHYCWGWINIVALWYRKWLHWNTSLEELSSPMFLSFWLWLTHRKLMCIGNCIIKVIVFQDPFQCRLEIWTDLCWVHFCISRIHSRTGRRQAVQHLHCVQPHRCNAGQVQKGECSALQQLSMGHVPKPLFSWYLRQQKIKTSEKVKKTGYVCLMSFGGGGGEGRRIFQKQKCPQR